MTDQATLEFRVVLDAKMLRKMQLAGYDVAEDLARLAASTDALIAHDEAVYAGRAVAL